MLKYRILILLLLTSWLAGSQMSTGRYFYDSEYYYNSTAKCYNELAFPTDLNKYPILIGVDSLQGKGSNYTQERIKEFRDLMIEKGHECHIIHKREVEKFDSEKYPYFIDKYPVKISTINYMDSSPSSSYKVTYQNFYYKIYDRRAKIYRRVGGRPKGNFAKKNKYRPHTITETEAKKYFKDLTRWIISLDDNGIEKTIELEVKKEKYRKRRFTQVTSISVVLAGAATVMVLNL